MNKKKKGKLFVAGDCVIAENTIFYLLRDLNLVCKKKIDTGEMELYPGVPEGKAFGKQMASRIMIWEKELVFIPRSAKAIWISDMGLHNWKRIKYETAAEGMHKEYATLQAFFYENRLYIIGSDYPAIMCLDSEKNLTYIREPYQRFMPGIDMMREFFFRKAFAIRKNIIYLASCRDNFVLKLWLDTYTYEWIEVGTKGNRYVGIAFDGEYFWLAPRCNDSPIVKWDGDKMVEEITLWDDFKCARRPFLGVLNVGSGILFPGYEQKNSLFVSKQGKMERVEGQYVFYNESDKGDFFVQCVNGTLLHILQDKNIQDISCIVTREAFLRLLDQNIDNFGLLFHEKSVEENVIRLEDTIRLLLNSDISYSFFLKSNYGQRVWKTISKKNRRE